MNLEDIKEKLNKWLVDFIEQPNPKFGNWAPCPYARTARINNKINIISSTVDQLAYTVKSNIPNLNKYEVIIIAFDHNDISGKDCLKLVKDLNQEIIPLNCVVLEDHPDIPEVVGGVKMNFGSCGLIVMQQLDLLNQAADKLKKAGYYHCWDQEALDKIVTWRY